MPWPDVAEFQQFLTASGLYGVLPSLTPTAIQQALDLQGALSAAIDDWNYRTRYWPFLSTGNSSEQRNFDPAIGGMVDFNGGLVTLTLFRTQVTYANPVGVTRVLNRDFYLRPSDAPNQNKPWTYATAGLYGLTGIESGWQQSIAITGEWGFCTDANLPSKARRAVMCLAASELMPQITLQLRQGGLDRISQGDETKQWSQKINDMRDFWMAEADGYQNFYQRPRFA